MRRAIDGLFAILCAATLCVVLYAIARGPGDLYEKDQPKTIAYTADVVLHGRWALPRDVIYQPATKPPLYNWIDAGVVWATGSWGELSLKAPSVIGAIGVCVLLWWTGATWRVALLAIAMFAAVGVDVRHGSTMRLAFLARPDMLQAFFVTLAWWAATRAFMGATDEYSSSVPGRERTFKARMSVLIRGTHASAMLFWLGVIGAILTKGPLALLLFVYAPIAARVVGGRWSAIRVLKPLVGFAATFAIVGAWLACAYRVDPAHVRGVMLGAEIVDRIASETPEGLSKPFYFAAMWFVTKGGPIAIVAIVGAIVALWRRERLMTAAAIWLIVLIAGLSLPAGKRIDYLLPTYAPAALLAAWVCVEGCRRVRVPIAVAALLPLALSIQLAHARLTKFGETKSRWTDHTVAFTRDIARRIGTDSLVVIVRGKHPIPTLLGRHQGSALTVDDLRAARWAILDVSATSATPTLVSAPIPHGFDDIDHRELAPVGLYDLSAADAPSIDTLVREQQNIGRWTAAENPYRAPGTVWEGQTQKSK